ncbi:sigma-70 family RNA polymerase sigma factor [Cytobacillus horneckiae]|uniref:sigma-70 family RNA polymerase sigma factor n=1 Tax=Cytobacillus horneckiae TaxID=549687 RepID=UPI00203F1ADC|nr:sigma-70 family RNA polymerase sigma factor [Cytobacillus horneckiae]
MNTAAVQLFEENQELIFTAIKMNFKDFGKAHRIAGINNMELDDLIQVGQETLWNLCLKADETLNEKFKGYAYKSIRWMIFNELRIRGLPIKTNLRVSVEDRNKLQFHSIDLYIDDDSKVINEFFANDYYADVENKVVNSQELEEMFNHLTKVEQSIFIHIAQGYSEREIGEKIGKSTTWVNKNKRKAIEKIKAIRERARDETRFGASKGFGSCSVTY